MKHRTTFFLKEPKGNKETPINAHLYFNRKRFKIATGLVVHPKHWDSDQQRAKRGTKFQTIINDRLNEIELLVAGIYEELRRSRVEITPEKIRERFTVAQEPIEPPESERSFFDYYQEFIDEAEGRLQRGTIQVHNTAKGHLKKFSDDYGITITFDRIDSIFLDKFVGYLVRVADLNNTTAWKVLRTVRVFLKHSLDRGYSKNEEYRKFTKKNMPHGEKSLPVYLTVEELQKIMNLDLSNCARLEHARDLFIFQTHTGLRYTDVGNVRPEHIKGDVISLVTQKNRKAIRIPFLPAARAVWEKYAGKLPVISNQRQNDYVKELAAKAEINTNVITVDYQGIKRIEKVVPKHKLISTHTAKRTFVTILRGLGISVEAIMRITGNSRGTIETYILTTEDDATREVELAWSRKVQIPAATSIG